MNANDLIDAICWLPLEERATGRSHVDLIYRTGYLDQRDEVTVDPIRSYLFKRPDLIDAWQIWVDDNRSTPAWYVRDAPPGFDVGLIGRDGRMVKRRFFNDRAQACAEFIVRELEQIGDIAEVWLSPWKWVGKLIRRLRQSGGRGFSDRNS